MKFFKTLGTKPWLHDGDVGAVAVDYSGPHIDAASRIALRFILVVVSVIFFLFIITFLARSQYPDFEALSGAPWQPFTDPSRLWINTALLALASAAMQLGGIGSAARQTEYDRDWHQQCSLFYRVVYRRPARFVDAPAIHGLLYQ